MSTPEHRSGSGPDDERGRLDRELGELLNELRVTIPGVQVLFAFLLTVSFSPRFEDLRDATIDVYFASVLFAALASILLTAPAAHHRIRFRDHAKSQLIRVANLMALLGMISLALALGGAVYVVADLIYGGGRASLAAGAVAGGAAVIWFVVPLFYRSADYR